MARIEQSNNNKDSKVEQLETEINRLKKGLKRKSNKKLLSCSNCFFVFLLLVILVVGFGAYLLAKSGLKDVPYLSDKFYIEPEPTRLVEINDHQETADLFEIFKKELVSESLTQGKAGDFSVTMTLDEEYLSSILREKIQENKSLSNKIGYVQTAVLEDNIEIFLKNKEPSRMILVLNIVPGIDNNKLTYKVSNFQIGNLQLPDVLAKIFLSPLFAVLNKSLDFYSDYGYVEKIEIKQPRLEFEIFINKALDF